MSEPQWKVCRGDRGHNVQRFAISPVRKIRWFSTTTSKDLGETEDRWTGEVEVFRGELSACLEFLGNSCREITPLPAEIVPVFKDIEESMKIADSEIAADSVGFFMETKPFVPK